MLCELDHRIYRLLRFQILQTNGSRIDLLARRYWSITNGQRNMRSSETCTPTGAMTELQYIKLAMEVAE
jgi:hypothetical protein